MKRLLIFVLVIISVESFGQNPGNYTWINGKYRWQSGMFDSTFRLPRYNGVPSGLRNGEWSTMDGALVADTANGHFYGYWNTTWKRLAYFTDIASGAVNIYNTSGMLTGNRILSGNAHTYSLRFDSLDTWDVARNGVQRMYVNSTATGLYSPTGLNAFQIYNDSIQVKQIAGNYSIYNLPQRFDTSANKVLTWNASTLKLGWSSYFGSAGGSGTVNSGAALKAAYYPSAAALVDDWIGVEFGNTNLNTKITAQAATEVPLEIKHASTPSANYLNISSSAGTGDVAKITSAGETLINGVSDKGAYLIQTTGSGGLYAADVPSNGSLIEGNASSGAGNYFAVQNGAGTKWNIYAGGGMNMEIGAASTGTVAIAPGFSNTITFNTSGGLWSKRNIEKQGADVASAAGAITLGTDGNTFEITGTSAITRISNLTWQNGSIVTLLFTSTASLVDGTANSGTDIGLELLGNINYNAVAGETITLVLSEIGGTQRWREKGRSRESSVVALNKAVTIEAPSAAEAIDMWQTPVAITVTSLKAILRGSSPSVTYNIRFGTDITSSTDVFTSNITCTSVTTGCSNSTGFNDATIPAGSFIWVITSAMSGTVTSISLTLNYTED